MIFNVYANVTFLYHKFKYNVEDLHHANNTTSYFIHSHLFLFELMNIFYKKMKIHLISKFYSNFCRLNLFILLDDKISTYK